MTVIVTENPDRNAAYAPRHIGRPIDGRPVCGATLPAGGSWLYAHPGDDPTCRACIDA